MELRLLVTFEKVATVLSFTRAAAGLAYAQSSVTSQIRALETSLGTELFERLGSRIRLTEAGERLLPYARQIIAPPSAWTSPNFRTVNPCPVKNPRARLYAPSATAPKRHRKNTTVNGEAPDSTTKIPRVPDNTIARVSSTVPRTCPAPARLTPLSFLMPPTLRTPPSPGPRAGGASCRWPHRGRRSSLPGPPE